MATRTPHQLRNFISLVTSTVAFRVASTFVSLEIVIPMLVERLTGSASLVGIANAFCYGSWLLPQMVAGRMMQEKPRKYPYLVGGALGRIFYWPIVLALWAGMARRPLLMVAILLICFAIYRASDGVTAVAYFDIVGRAAASWPPPPSWAES